jgi:hypothetical protein
VTVLRGIRIRQSTASSSQGARKEWTAINAMDGSKTNITLIILPKVKKKIRKIRRIKKIRGRMQDLPMFADR